MQKTQTKVVFKAIPVVQHHHGEDDDTQWVGRLVVLCFERIFMLCLERGGFS